MPLVETRNLQKQFGANQVLKGIDFAVERGTGRVDHRTQRLGQEHACCAR